MIGANNEHAMSFLKLFPHFRNYCPPINFEICIFADELEVEALFERELGKMYNEENPEDDMVEKVGKDESESSLARTT